MDRPIVIVDPRSSGIELAPAFRARGLSSIGITFEPINSHAEFGKNVRPSDFLHLFPKQANLEEILRKYNPLAIIPGAENGVPLANTLADSLTPHFANDPQKLLCRFHKAHMQLALKAAGLPYIRTLDTSSESDVEAWLIENDLVDARLILKPPVSAGSDKVFHIPAKANWRAAFRRILTEPAMITGQPSETAIIQEEVIGTEFAVGTVSANGKHSLVHLIKYNKISFNDRKTVFDHVEFLPFDEKIHSELFEYTKNALDAIGMRWGAAHNEVMLTEKGPRLIETGARMLGGPTIDFAREATGSSQADRLVEAYIDGKVSASTHAFKKTVIPVFLRSPLKGTVSNVEALEGISDLPTLFRQHVWFKNHGPVPQTVDYSSSIGIVALSGDRESIFQDYKKIRAMESKLIFRSSEAT